MEHDFCPPPGTAWQRSSACINDHHCVELAADDEFVYMRNSKVPERYLRFARRDWPGVIDRFASAEPAPRTGEGGPA